jgi:hypothetical protein
MNSVVGWLLMGLAFGGAVYFWQKAITLGLSWTEIIVCYLVWPIAVVRGLYFLVVDAIQYIKSK